jgi:hypothetical protein
MPFLGINLFKLYYMITKASMNTHPIKSYHIKWRRDEAFN